MKQVDKPQGHSIRRDPRAIALMIAASLTVMAAATISPALPGLERQLAQNPTDVFLVRLLVPAPSLAVVLAAPLCGAIADRSGRRRMLLAGLVLFAAAGSVGLFLPTLSSILASRLCLGIALAMIMTAQSALLGDYFSGVALHAVSSSQVFARNMGGFVFILTAGFLATLGPRLPFLVYALPLIALPFFWRVIVDVPRGAPARKVEATSSFARPQRLVLLLALGQMMVTIAFFVMPTQLPFFLLSQGRTSPAMTGAALAALMLAGGGAALCYPRLRAAIGNAGNWACGFGLMAVGFATLFTVTSDGALLLSCSAVGAGYALATPGFVVLSLSAATPDKRGKTAAWLTGSVFLGQFLSPFVSNPAIALWGWHASGLGLAIALAGAASICGITGWHRQSDRPGKVA